MVSKNFNFIMNADLSKYSGSWVAVSGNKVVATGVSASEVLTKAKKASSKKSTIMRIPEKKQILLL